jgi:hypothetical protein
MTTISTPAATITHGLSVLDVSSMACHLLTLPEPLLPAQISDPCDLSDAFQRVCELAERQDDESGRKSLCPLVILHTFMRSLRSAVRRSENELPVFRELAASRTIVKLRAASARGGVVLGARHTVRHLRVDPYPDGCLRVRQVSVPARDWSGGASAACHPRSTRSARGKSHTTEYGCSHA